MPTRKPTFRVLVMAVVKRGMAKMRRNVSRLSEPSPTKLSTSRMASG